MTASSETRCKLDTIALYVGAGNDDTTRLMRHTAAITNSNHRTTQLAWHRQRGQTTTRLTVFTVATLSPNTPLTSSLFFPLSSYGSAVLNGNIGMRAELYSAHCAYCSQLCCTRTILTPSSSPLTDASTVSANKDTLVRT